MSKSPKVSDPARRMAGMSAMAETLAMQLNELLDSKTDTPLGFVFLVFDEEGQQAVSGRNLPGRPIQSVRQVMEDVLSRLPDDDGTIQ